MKRLWTILGVLLGLLSPTTAFGLSCARPSLDSTAIDAAVVIFEGTVSGKRSLDFHERAVVTLLQIKGKGGSTDDFRVYRFSVTQGWKGALSGQSVDVLFNSYWGDGFTEGEAYLVAGAQQVGNLFWAPLCGHTIDLKHAAEFGELAMLEKLIGIGHHMKISISDRVCRRGEDCAWVQTHCGDCSCGSPVAKRAVERYEKQFEMLCATIRIAERCEMDCPLRTPSCSIGHCVLSD